MCVGRCSGAATRTSRNVLTPVSTSRLSAPTALAPSMSVSTDHRRPAACPTRRRRLRRAAAAVRRLPGDLRGRLRRRGGHRGDHRAVADEEAVRWAVSGRRWSPPRVPPPRWRVPPRSGTPSRCAANGPARPHRGLSSAVRVRTSPTSATLRRDHRYRRRALPNPPALRSATSRPRAPACALVTTLLQGRVETDFAQVDRHFGRLSAGVVGHVANAVGRRGRDCFDRSRQRRMAGEHRSIEVEEHRVVVIDGSRAPRRRNGLTRRRREIQVGELDDAQLGIGEIVDISGGGVHEPGDRIIVTTGGQQQLRRRRNRAWSPRDPPDPVRGSARCSVTTALSASPRSSRAPASTMSISSRSSPERSRASSPRAMARARSGRPRPRSQSAMRAAAWRHREFVVRHAVRRVPLPFTGVVGRDTDRLTDHADPTCALTSGTRAGGGPGQDLRRQVGRPSR